jgi:hypothetical protein
MLVALAALVVALAGTAVAGVATTSKLSGKDRKQIAKMIRKEAEKLITKRAPGLSVAFAKSAGSATTLGKVFVEHATGSVGNFEGGSVDAFCPAGTQAIGGGGRADDHDEPRLLASRPTRAGGEPPGGGESFTGWRVSAFNDLLAPTIQPEVWVICVG